MPKTTGSPMSKLFSFTDILSKLYQSIGIYETPLKPVLQPYRKLADVIEASGLDYTILRPDWFTNADEVDYEITKKGEPEKGTAISRKSIAAFIGKIVNNPEKYLGENLNIAKPN
jgi:uncharacterized protein YbjT (DUF2867 family)